MFFYGSPSHNFDNLAGAQRANPATDRAKLEEALAFYAVRPAYPGTDHLTPVLEAARAHLATLPPKPEPMWHVTASSHGPEGTVAAAPYVIESHEVALTCVRRYLEQGYTNVNVRWVQS